MKSFLDERSLPGLNGATDADASPIAPLWLLGEALEHLRPFVAELAGLNGRLVTLELAVPQMPLATEDVARILPALGALLRDTVIHRIDDPVARLCAGKPLSARVVVDAIAANGVLRLSVRDDGVAPARGSSALVARIGTLGVALTDTAGGGRSLAMALRSSDAARSVAGPP